MKGSSLFIFIACVFISNYALAQIPSCLCDTRELPNGLTGNEIVEILCPGGELGEDASFILTPEEVSIQSEIAKYEVSPFSEIARCVLEDNQGGETDTKLVGQQIADCRQRLIQGCKLSQTPIPTLSEWGMIAAAAGLGLAGIFFAVRRKRAVA